MAGVNFSLDTAKRILATVKRVEGTPQQMGGTPNPGATPGTTFWAALTGCDSTGLWWDWIAVMPAANNSTVNQPWSFTASDMWTFREPYTAGWGNLREANATRGIEAGTVVRVEFIGYTTPSAPTPAGTVTQQGGSPPTSTGMSSGFSNGFQEQEPVPLYLFQYALQPALSELPIHDHRDNGAGGFSFSTYHPGTNLPQQRWGL